MQDQAINIDAKFEMVFKRDFYKVRYYAYSYIGDMEQAQNIAQDTFYQLWKNREKVNFDQSPMPYLLLIAKNLSLNLLRKETSKKHYTEYKKAYTIESFNIETMESESTSLLYSEEVRQLFKQGLDKMPSYVRETFLLSRTDNLSYGEIADKLNISRKTVEGRMTMALKILRKVFKDYLPFFVGCLLSNLFIN